MNARANQIGVDRIIRLDWLEKTANLVMAGNVKTSINEILQDLLKDNLSGGKPGVRGSREKTITILMKIWLTVPCDLEALRNEGLQILQGLPRKDRIAVHWGILLAVYPFWGAVATHTGRLLRLQGTAAAAHIQRRVKEQYGERETASRAVQRVLRSFIDWNVLIKTDDKGVYDQGNSYSIQDPRLIAWLVEASLHARTNSSANIKDLLGGPSIFPFRLAHIAAEHLASLSPRLDLLRHGLDEDLVILRQDGGQVNKRGFKALH